MWDVAKYTAFSARGFGTFNPAGGRWLHGIELRKSLWLQAGNLKRAMWEMKIRAPMANRVPSGIALVQRGAEDGRGGTKDTSMLNDCFRATRKVLKGLR